MKLENPKFMKTINFKIQKKIIFSSKTEFKNSCENMNPFQRKGFIFLKKDFSEKNNFFFISKNYISLSLVSNLISICPFNLDGEMDKKQILTLFLTKKINFYLFFFPEWKEIIKNEMKNFEEISIFIQRKFEEIKEKEDKEMMRLLKGVKCHSMIVFMKKRNIFSTEELFGRNQSLFEKAQKEYFEKEKS